MKKSFVAFCTFLSVWCVMPLAGYGAYHHEGEIDSPYFLSVYPDKANTKLDNCALCHKGGTYEKKTYGSCQYCHVVYDLTGTTHGRFYDTLNSYGLAYIGAGRNKTAISAIENIDSDGDGFTNIAEILAGRYPGDENDDPSKVQAPSKVYSMAQLEAMPRHTQFMLLNATRSDDHYSEYSGVPLKYLLDDAGIDLEKATGIIVYSPDGFSYTYTLYATEGEYHVYGNETGKDYQYPPATYYYNSAADKTLFPTNGWCYWDSPSCTGRSHGDSIHVGDGGLKAILAFKRDGNELVTGILNSSNKLDGEGPFRVVVPQKVPGEPDQPSRYTGSSEVWPYVLENDHNAGACSRTATIIKVLPLPEGTTDIDIMEAGWKYVDEKKIVIYGAILGGSDTDTPKEEETSEKESSSSDDDGICFIDIAENRGGCSPDAALFLGFVACLACLGSIRRLRSL